MTRVGSFTFYHFKILKNRRNKSTILHYLPSNERECTNISSAEHRQPTHQHRRYQQFVDTWTESGTIIRTPSTVNRRPDAGCTNYLSTFEQKVTQLFQRHASPTDAATPQFIIIRRYSNRKCNNTSSAEHRHPSRQRWSLPQCDLSLTERVQRPVSTDMAVCGSELLSNRKSVWILSRSIEWLRGTEFIQCSFS